MVTVISHSQTEKALRIFHNSSLASKIWLHVLFGSSRVSFSPMRKELISMPTDTTHTHSDRQTTTTNTLPYGLSSFHYHLRNILIFSLYPRTVTVRKGEGGYIIDRVVSHCRSVSFRPYGVPSSNLSLFIKFFILVLPTKMKRCYHCIILLNFLFFCAHSDFDLVMKCNEL